MSPDLRERIERFFLQAGMPHLQRDYDPREESLTRLAPVLALIFLVGLGGSFADTSPVGRVVTIAGFIAAAFAVYGIINLMRRRRFFGSSPRPGSPTRTPAPYGRLASPAAK